MAQQPWSRESATLPSAEPLYVMKYALNILLLFTLFQSSAQNLVPNPSFEDTVQCTMGLVSDAVGWENYSALSPDYFHSCVGGGSFYVPYNWGGYQPAATGNAYCAMSAFYPPTPDEREIIGRNLASPMIIGTEYFVSFKASLSLDSIIESSHACNKLGVLFSTYAHVPFTAPAPINNFAHVYTNDIITDTAGWTVVSGSFIADSAYTHIAIGNFFDDNNTDTLELLSTPNFNWCYYYIDDICVSTDSLTCVGNVGIEELSKPDKKLVWIVDTMGRETGDKPNTLLIYIYSDGTTEKVFRVE